MIAPEATPVAQFTVDSLRVIVHEDRARMGRAAAQSVAHAIAERQARAGQARVVFAAAPSQDEFLAMVDGYVKHFAIPADPEELRREALEWSTTRGSRSGRVAWQFIQDYAGRKGVRLT